MTENGHQLTEGNTKGGHACTETGTARVFERESVCVGSVQERVNNLMVGSPPFIYQSGLP